MAEAVVSSVVEILRDLLVEEAKLLAGVGEKAEELEKELILLQCLLKDADTKKRKDATVRRWIGEIRRLSYQAESILEEFAFNVEKERRWLGGNSGINYFLKTFIRLPSKCKTLHRVGFQIASIQKRIANLRASMESYNILASHTHEDGESSNMAATKEREKWRRKTYGHAEVEEYFVGREEDMKKLVSFVTDDEHHHIVSIWGMGGSGKTTLARKIYNHPSVKPHFEAFAWVCVTQECRPTSVWEDVFKQLVPSRRDQVKNMDDQNLVSELVQLQKQTKCLVILDDIWSLDDWKTVRHAFATSERGGTVLLTTRTKQVADVGVVHQLNCLSEKDGWELLKILAFGSEAVTDAQEFVAAGNQVVHKCGGHPLAICVLGGILRGRSLLDWEKLNTNMDLYLMGNDSGTGDGHGEIRKVLGLSYDYLPSPLKPCLLYLARFPEDHDIDIGSLYKLWIAEGMISSNSQGRQETKMEVAERYLGELANRSMVQVQMDLEESSGSTTRFKTCRLHDLMREFALAQGEEDGFLRVMDLRGVKQPKFSGSVSIESSCSRLAIFSSINNDASVLPLELVGCNELRSLMLISYGRLLGKLPIKISNFKVFKEIRVLELQRIRFERYKLPQGIENLIHLRYLGLIFCLFDELPSSFGSFPYLETLSLVVRSEPVPVKLPNVLWQLKRLRHLWLEGLRPSQGKLRLAGLDLLETLDTFDASYMDLNDLPKLKNLRFLSANISGNEQLLMIIDHLNIDLNCLHEARLTISDCKFMSGEESAVLREVLMCQKVHGVKFDCCEIDRLPEHTPHMALNLTELVFFSTSIKHDPMATVEKFPKLLRCNIGYYLDGKELVCHAKGFPQLIEFKICEFSSLKKLSVDEGAMPNLARFRLGFRDDRTVRSLLRHDFYGNPDRLKQYVGVPDRLKQLVVIEYGHY